MYETHPLFVPPPNDAILWRYMDFTKFVSLLDTSSLFFSRADLLGDPFEGVWTQTNIETLGDRYPPEVAESIRNALPNLQQLTSGNFVNCWHWNESESDAMWKIYAQQSAGVAIKTDFKSLADSFTDDQTIYIGKVHYIDYAVDLVPEGNSFGPLLYKRNHFEHEREVRAMISAPPPLNQKQPGRHAQVDLSRLIHEVRISPLAPVWFSDLVQSIAVKFNVNVAIVNSSLSDSPPLG